MRAEGHTYEVIAEVLGIAPMTASMYAQETVGLATAIRPASKSLPSGSERAAARAELSARIRGEEQAEEQAERDKWRAEAEQELAMCRQLGTIPSWYPASQRLLTDPPPSPHAQEAIDQLAEEQAKDNLWATSAFKRRRGWMASLDEPVKKDESSDSDATTRGELIEGSSIDPVEIVAGNSPEHIEALVGDLTIEDVELLGDSELQRIREKLLKGGVAPPAVQQRERERLRENQPHRGEGPAALRAKKSSRHRGRSEASATHKSRGKRFKRRWDKAARDGWGSMAA